MSEQDIEKALNDLLNAKKDESDEMHFDALKEGFNQLVMTLAAFMASLEGHGFSRVEALALTNTFMNLLVGKIMG